MAARKSPISDFLLTTLWARKRPPGVRRGSTRSKKACSPLPGVEEDQVELTLLLGNTCERVARDRRDDV
jgi:hypothetical protein